MIIFIDTNLVYNSWHLQNANFQYLFNFLENTNSILAVSELICEEINHKFKVERETVKKGFENNIKKATTILNNDLTFDFNQLESNYNFKEIISRKTRNVEFYNYSEIPNSTLVNRAINKIKPFKEDDKGFRDSLIWLSFLDYVIKKGNAKIAFINNNSSDFYNTSKTGFHENLQKDIENLNLGNEFNVYESIKDFIEKEVGFKHTYTKSNILEEFIYPNEIIIEKMLQTYINSQSANWFSVLIKSHSTAFKDIVYLTNFNFDIIEGIEEAELLNWEQIEQNKFFSQMSFCLRKVELEFAIPKYIYEERAELFKFKITDVEFDADNAILYAYRKIYLNISFNFDAKKTAVTDLDINMFGILS